MAGKLTAGSTDLTGDSSAAVPSAGVGGAAVSPSPTIERFSLASRITHWSLAVPFVILLTTGLLLFIPEVKGLHVGGYRLVPLIHVVTGIALLIALLPAVVLRRRSSALRSDLGLLVRREPADGRWLRSAGYRLLGAKLSPPATGKFNAGQKLNTVASGLFTAGLLVSGIVLGINYFTKRVFGARFVEQVYPYHDWFTLIALPIVLGHIYLAVLNPDTRASMRGMISGRVNRTWAAAHHRLWVSQEERTRSG